MTERETAMDALMEAVYRMAAMDADLIEGGPPLAGVANAGQQVGQPRKTGIAYASTARIGSRWPVAVAVISGGRCLGTSRLCVARK